MEDTLEIEGAEAEQEMDFNEDQESECKKEHEYDIALYTCMVFKISVNYAYNGSSIQFHSFVNCNLPLQPQSTATYSAWSPHAFLLSASDTQQPFALRQIVVLRLDSSLEREMLQTLVSDKLYTLRLSAI